MTPLDRRDAIAEALKAADYIVMFDGMVSAIDIAPLVDAVDNALSSREDGWRGRYIALVDRLSDLLFDLSAEGDHDMGNRIIDAMADPESVRKEE